MASAKSKIINNTLAIFYVGLLILSPPAFAEMLVLTANLERTDVTFNIPAELKVGDSPSLEIYVAVHSGSPAPTKVRARLGMPEMGHWVTEEEARDYSSEGIHQFNGVFAHLGVYRFRIWIDYADGNSTKTALDFTVAPDFALEPKIVP